jgi:hypothetical protein
MRMAAETANAMLHKAALTAQTVDAGHHSMRLFAVRVEHNATLATVDHGPPGNY